MLVAGVRGATLAWAWRRPSEMAPMRRWWSNLTGDHHQPPGTDPYVFLCRKLQRHATNSHRRVSSLIKQLIMIYYYFNDISLYRKWLWLDGACGRVGSGGPWWLWDDGGRHGRSMPVCSCFASFITTPHRTISPMDKTRTIISSRAMNPHRTVYHPLTRPFLTGQPHGWW
jgi:hypothetical protein